MIPAGSFWPSFTCPPTRPLSAASAACALCDNQTGIPVDARGQYDRVRTWLRAAGWAIYEGRYDVCPACLLDRAVPQSAPA